MTDHSGHKGPDKNHYTAQIMVTHTVVTEERVSGGHSTRTRKVHEVAKVVVRSDSIDSLVAKATAHLNLVEDY